MTFFIIHSVIKDKGRDFESEERFRCRYMLFKLKIHPSSGSLNTMSVMSFSFTINWLISPHSVTVMCVTRTQLLYYCLSNTWQDAILWMRSVISAVMALAKQIFR